MSLEKNVRVLVITGSLNGISGPVADLAVPVEYLDVTLSAEADFAHSVRREHNAFAYVFEGSAFFDEGSKRRADSENLVEFTDGEEIRVKAGKIGTRFLLVSGRPIGEPIAWGGPVVMNTKAELDTAFDELEKGTFIKVRPS